MLLKMELSKFYTASVSYITLNAETKIKVKVMVMELAEEMERSFPKLTNVAE